MGDPATDPTDPAAGACVHTIVQICRVSQVCHWCSHSHPWSNVVSMISSSCVETRHKKGATLDEISLMFNRLHVYMYKYKYNKLSPLAEEHIHGLLCCATSRYLKVALVCLGADIITRFSIAFVLSTTQQRHLGCQTNSNKIKPMSDIAKVTGHHWLPLHVQVTQHQGNP